MPTPLPLPPAALPASHRLPELSAPPLQLLPALTDDVPEPPVPPPGPAPNPGPLPPPPPPPDVRLLSAARISCSIFCGSSKMSRNLSPWLPSILAVNCAATLIPATDPSSATNRISLIFMAVSPASAVFSCSARAVAFAPLLGNARTKRENCACVVFGAKWMLAIPDEVSSCAKLFSAAAAPSGTPSSRIWFPEAPSSKPVSPLSSSAVLSSFQAASNCAAVRTCPNSYKRANFNRMFRVRTKDRAVARVSLAIPADLPSDDAAYYTRTLSPARQAPLPRVSPCQ